MNKTTIEWTDCTWNPISGCRRHCKDKEGGKYCYAERMSKRLEGRFGYPRGDPFRPTFHPGRLKEPYRLRKPLRIFTCSMGEMFGDWISQDWIEAILKGIDDNPRHTFQILTKNPKRLPEIDFPPNVWVGMSIDQQTAVTGLRFLLDSNAEVKFVSLEPLLEKVDMDLSGLGWVIIGGLTGARPFIPEKKWVNQIILQARKVNVPIFLKDNLFWEERIQKFPVS